MFQFKIAGKEIFSFGRSVENPQYPLSSNEISKIFFGNETDSGISVNEEKSLGISAVYSAVRVIAESLATLPLQIFRTTSNGREVQKKHPLYKIIHDQPNNFMSAFTFRETLAGHQCLWGNAYAMIERDGAGRVTQLIPLPPENYSIKPKLDTKRWKIYYVLNGKETIEQSNILHMPALSFDGVEGLSPITIARESMGLAMATQKLGARFFGNGANPDFVMEHPGKLGDKALANLKKSFKRDYKGVMKSHETPILEEGMKLNRLSIPPEEAQFLQTRKFQISEVARWFRIPPHLLADLDRATFNSVEQLDLGFVKYCLNPWFERWEQEMNRKLLTEDEKSDYYIEFNVEGFLRGDIKTRTEYYTKMIANTVMSPNEVRRLENMNDRPDGNTYQNPNTSSPKTAIPAPKDKVKFELNVDHLRKSIELESNRRAGNGHISDGKEVL